MHLRQNLSGGSTLYLDLVEDAPNMNLSFVPPGLMTKVYRYRSNATFEIYLDEELVGKYNVYTKSPDRLMLDGNSERPEINNYIIELNRIHELQPPTEPRKPVEPKDRNLDVWFDYYHHCNQAGYNFTLKEVAMKTKYKYGYVRLKHSEYLAEHKDLLDT